MSIFRQGISAATLLQLVADLSWLFIAGVLVIRFNEQYTIPINNVVGPSLVFAVVIVTLNINMGQRYVVESSSDMVTWKATGPAFTAPSDTIEQEFDVSLTGRFFRVRQVP